MVVLDIIAPILLMFGISRTNAANVSLLNNFEIVATSLTVSYTHLGIVKGAVYIAEFVKRGALGTYRAVSGGNSNPECTHVILTREEYEQIVRQKAKAESEEMCIRDRGERERWLSL